MSPDGGLEELPECFLALANSSLHLANSFSNFSTLAANSAQPGHSGCCEEPSMMVLNLTHETEIGQGRIFGVNGYRLGNQISDALRSPVGFRQDYINKL